MSFDNTSTKVPLVFDKCRNFGATPFEGYLIYCLYKEQWVELQKDLNNNNGSEQKIQEAKKVFQKTAVKEESLLNYQARARDIIEQYTSDFVSKHVQKYIEDTKNKLESEFNESKRKYYCESRRKNIERRGENIKKWGHDTFWGKVLVEVVVIVIVIILAMIAKWLSPVLLDILKTVINYIIPAV